MLSSEVPKDFQVIRGSMNWERRTSEKRPSRESERRAATKGGDVVALAGNDERVRKLSLAPEDIQKTSIYFAARSSHTQSCEGTIQRLLPSLFCSASQLSLIPSSFLAINISHEPRSHSHRKQRHPSGRGQYLWSTRHRLGALVLANRKSCSMLWPAPLGGRCST